MRTYLLIYAELFTETIIISELHIAIATSISGLALKMLFLSYPISRTLSDGYNIICHFIRDQKLCLHANIKLAHLIRIN